MRSTHALVLLLILLLPCPAFPQRPSESWAIEPERPKELPFPIPAAALREAEVIQRAAEAGKVFEARIAQVPDLTDGFSYVLARARTIEQIRSSSGLALSPTRVPLNATPGLALLGAVPAGTRIESGWTGLTRLYQHPKLGQVLLEEQDLGRSGGWVKFAYFNCSVSGQPGVFVRMSAPGGKTQTTLTWQSNQVLFKLTLMPIDDSVRQNVISFAETFGN